MLFPEKLKKMSTLESKNVSVPYLDYFRPITHHSSRFRGNPLSSFCVVLLTDQPTDKGKNITFLAEVFKHF